MPGRGTCASTPTTTQEIQRRVAKEQMSSVSDGGSDMGLLERWDRRNQGAAEQENRREREGEERWHKLHRTVMTSDGTRLTVEAQPSGYPVRTYDNAEDAIGLVVMFVALPIAWLRHRFQFHGGWNVAVLRPRRFWREKIERIERVPDEASAIALVDAIVTELEAPQP